MASGDNGGIVKLWNSKTGELKHELKGHSSILINLFIAAAGSYINELKFTKDGKTLVSCSGDYTLRFWYVDNGV